MKYPYRDSFCRSLSALAASALAVVILGFLISPRAHAQKPLVFPAISFLQLCPQPSEISTATAVLTKTLEFQGSMNGFTLPIEATAMTNPLTGLMAKSPGEDEFRPIDLSEQARVSYRPWYSGGADTEYRSGLVFVGVRTQGGEKLELGWELFQERNIHTGEIKLNSTEIVEFMVGDMSPSGRPQRLARMAYKTRCMQEAYQGAQPGTLWGLGEVAGNERVPVESQSYFLAIDSNFKVEVRIAGRSSIAGFDKTSFMAVDEMEITGLLPKPIKINQYFKAVQAASHHNFEDQFIGDLNAAIGLMPQEREALKGRDLRYLLVRHITVPEANEHGVSESWNVYVVVGLNENMIESKILGIVRRQSGEHF